MDVLPQDFCETLNVYRLLKRLEKNGGNEPLLWKPVVEWFEGNGTDNKYALMRRFDYDEHASEEIKDAYLCLKNGQCHDLARQVAQLLCPRPQEFMLPSLRVSAKEYEHIQTHFPTVTIADMYAFIADHILVTNDDVQKIASEPQGTALWLRYRRHRLTGSNYGTAAGINPYKNGSAMDLVRNMLFYEEMDARGKFNCAYGNTHEDIACEQYERYMRRKFGLDSDEFRVEHRGLEVHPFEPWSGDSKDGIVFQKGIPKPFLLEIKCPAPPQREWEASVANKEMVNTKPDWEAQLLRNKIYDQIPPYYYAQIQGISHWNRYDYIDFCVWTYDQTEIKRFPIDRPYLDQFLMPRLRFWWFCAYLPNAVMVERGDITMACKIEDVPTVPPDEAPQSNRLIQYGVDECESKKRKFGTAFGGSVSTVSSFSNFKIGVPK